MTSKTISLHVEAYERLRKAKLHAGESFSDVVMRARWPEEPMTGAELLEHRRATGPLLGDSELERIEQLKRVAEPPSDKWQTT